MWVSSAKWTANVATYTTTGIATSAAASPILRPDTGRERHVSNAHSARMIPSALAPVHLKLSAIPANSAASATNAQRRPPTDARAPRYAESAASPAHRMSGSTSDSRVSTSSAFSQSSAIAPSSATRRVASSWRSRMYPSGMISVPQIAGSTRNTGTGASPNSVPVDTPAMCATAA